jgi:hypothetical protein
MVDLDFHAACQRLSICEVMVSGAQMLQMLSARPAA